MNGKKIMVQRKIAVTRWKTELNFIKSGKKNYNLLRLNCPTKAKLYKPFHISHNYNIEFQCHFKKRMMENRQ